MATIIQATINQNILNLAVGRYFSTTSPSFSLLISFVHGDLLCGGRQTCCAEAGKKLEFSPHGILMGELLSTVIAAGDITRVLFSRVKTGISYV